MLARICGVYDAVTFETHNHTEGTEEVHAITKGGYKIHFTKDGGIKAWRLDDDKKTEVNPATHRVAIHRALVDLGYSAFDIANKVLDRTKA